LRKQDGDGTKSPALGGTPRFTSLPNYPEPKRLPAKVIPGPPEILGQLRVFIDK